MAGLSRKRPAPATGSPAMMVTTYSHRHPQPVVTLAGMARTVLIEDESGNTFRATRRQWERLHEPAGLTLVADEDGKPPRKPTAKKADKAKPTAKKADKAKPTGD